jgi:osmotically-inducible protein OsmY
MSNPELEANVRDQLTGDASLDSSRVKVDADGTSVVLSGVVDSLHQKLRAAEDAGRLTGVHAVRNDLIVNKAHDRVADADLKATAQAGLDANGLVPKDALTVTVDDGWITLAGNVRHYYQRQAAEHVVRHLSGVQGMTDKVTVSKDPAADVAKTIGSALTHHAAVDAGAVKVTDTDGAVTLTGTVKPWPRKKKRNDRRLQPPASSRSPTTSSSRVDRPRL